MNPQPPPRTSASGLRVVAIAVVCLALLAVAFVVWRQSQTETAGPGTPASPSATGVRASTPAATTRTTTATSAAPTARGSKDPVTGLLWVEESALPAQAKRVLGQIDRGGPYDYDKDGTTFRNAEGRLPSKANGFYREYTVVLPGSNDRGPVRIVVGGKGEWYFWTTDHYETFARIRR